MCLQKEIDNRLIQVLPANTPLTADLACIKLSERFPNLSHENLQAVVPVRLRTLSDFEKPGNTDMPYHYFTSAEGAECYLVNTSSVAWREAHPEYVPHRDIDMSNINIDLIIAPPGMSQEASKVNALDLIELANPKYREEWFGNHPVLFLHFRNKRKYVSNKWKMALYNPRLRIPVVNIVAALDDGNSWIKALLEELTTPLDTSSDNRIVPVSEFEHSYIVVPYFVLSETERRRIIGYLVLLKCMKDSQVVKNKVMKSLASWKNKESKKIFIKTMLTIATRICGLQIRQFFRELNPHGNWGYLYYKVLISLK